MVGLTQYKIKFSDLIWMWYDICTWMHSNLNVMGSSSWQIPSLSYFIKIVLRIIPLLLKSKAFWKTLNIIQSCPSDDDKFELKHGV
jgi:hypothetical protein